jgi:uncharacterized protein YcfJ
MISDARPLACNPNRLSSGRLIATALVTLALTTACSTGPKQPVFYPNSHMQQVGDAQSLRDTEECMQMAASSGVSQTKDGEIGQKTAKGAALGGVGAGVWGLFRGDAAERALAGAAAGAATGAVTGGFQSAETNPTYKRFVERCLRERGYDVIGWE